MRDPSRRAVLVGAASLIGGALTSGRASAQATEVQEADASQIYAAVDGEPFPVPAVNLSRIDPRFLRSYVDYDTTEAPGTIIVSPAERFLYLIDNGGQAIRYGVGVGREGFGWSGQADVRFKREWPDWYPPKEMLARDHSIMQVMSKLQGGIGMRGGPGNPLGARAHYLWQGNHDTLYRIHGTLEPWTIGTRVSSGCIRMINQDVIDLYSRVPLETKVIVLGSESPRTVSHHRHAPIEDQDTVDPYQTDPGYAPDPNQTY
jgi:lipoprotein-anchoring transpeptidase ErfK/SrfK